MGAGQAQVATPTQHTNPRAKACQSQPSTIPGQAITPQAPQQRKNKDTNKQGGTTSKHNSTPCTDSVRRDPARLSRKEAGPKAPSNQLSHRAGRPSASTSHIGPGPGPGGGLAPLRRQPGEAPPTASKSAAARPINARNVAPRPKPPNTPRTEYPLQTPTTRQAPQTLTLRQGRK